ncbi:AraC family transcriptional regulator [Rhodopseudomonas sp. AAP120]|uniref:AraC family transcriptional regulator n=1 Tax=Rhodopseudomonas sp. AAP120 TaxID=1523430 RepID=UPI0006B8EDB0|nr:helix-turn-helix transcriptional regulator [Rhodopseudomonas sp. AAP120]KPF95499.1 AraC family transcriptional regulator [Rhodopseudomonas sp. AAP120]
MSDASERANDADFPGSRAPAASTADTDDLRHVVIHFCAAQALSGEAESLQGVGDVVELEGTAFGFCRSRGGESPRTDFTRLQVALRSNGRAGAAASGADIDHEPRRASSAMPSPAEFGGGDEQMIIRCPNGTLMTTLESMLGVKPRGKLVFAPSTPIDDRGALALRDFALFLARHVDPAQPRLPPLMLRELEHALLVSLLSVARHNFSDQLDRDAPDTAPDYVRVAEEFIVSSWNRAITINDLAAVTSVGVRSLFKAFQKHRGYSPMAFAKSVRLNKARELLLQGEPSRSVTSVAFACGFSNLGHFAHDYRQKHGELPSETLARAR